MAGAADPGWRAIPALSFVPYIGLRRLQQGPQLLVLRAFTLLIAGTIPLFGIVIVVATGVVANPSISETAGVGGSMIAGATAVAMVALHGRHLLRGTTGSAGDRYAAGFYARQMIGQGAAVCGFVASLLSGSPWPYVAAAPFSLAALAMNAPTFGRVARAGPDVLDDLMKPATEKAALRQRAERANELPEPPEPT